MININKQEKTLSLYDNSPFDIKFGDIEYPSDINIQSDDIGIKESIQTSLQMLENGNEIQGIIALNNLTNALFINRNIKLSFDLISFLMLKIHTSDFIHPGYRKHALLFIHRYLSINKKLIDPFISAEFGNILISLLPDNVSIKIMKLCIQNSEQYRNTLFTQGFLQKIFELLKSIIDQTFFRRSSVLEHRCVSILTALQPYGKFSHDQITAFLFLFKRSWEQDHFQSPNKYLEHLLKSEDYDFITNFINCGLVPYVLQLFSCKIPETEQINIFLYLIKILKSSEECAKIFENIAISEFIDLLLKDYISQKAFINSKKAFFVLMDFIAALTQSSYISYSNVLTDSIFMNLFSLFQQNNYAIEQKTFQFFILFIGTYPNSPFIKLFVKFEEEFFEFLKVALESTDESLKLNIIKFLVIFLTNSAEIHSPFSDFIIKNVCLESFISSLDILSDTLDENSRRILNLLYDAINKIQCSQNLIQKL